MTQPASGPASHASSHAASSGSPQRPIGSYSSTAARVASSGQPVSVAPGSTVFTVILPGARWAARLAVTWRNAPLDAM
ncbi:hypothetical protein SAMN05443637_12121 [Pseudonocardia thermophila]|uniref:Uncharacterized protein n=1 Tax=Pseudonocardia thermophila TaxID=1848 RepID=A0A1M6YRN9_PSETH|nr:hypothetical protein SAMN05443637_12121 [Pseudonocardia thermophila]